jgi:hypothetical protein
MNRSTQIIYYLGLLLAFSYVIIRGFSVGITHDEALTYKIINGDEVLKGTANHHWLNTQLSALSTYVFGFKEFALRLPNILSFGIFWFFLFRIAKTFLKSSAAQIALLLLLCGNPFILDFFSLCRGYGLSIAFVTTSLYYLFRIVSLRENSRAVHYFLGTGFSILALSANLNTLNYFLVAQGLMFGCLLVFKSKNRFLLLIVLLILSGITLYFSLHHLFFLKAKDELYFGTNNLHTTIDSLICSSFYSRGGFAHVEILRYLVYGLMLVTAFLLIRKKRLFTPDAFAFLVLIGIFTALIAEHFLFKSLYPINRSSLYIYPIILLAFLLNIESLKSRLIQWLIVISSGSFILINIPFYNFERTVTWPEDQHIKEAMLLIKKDLKNQSIQVAECSWIYEPAINYYRKEYQIPIHEVFREDLRGEGRYLLVHQLEFLPKSQYRVRLFHMRECGLMVYSKNPSAAN